MAISVTALETPAIVVDLDILAHNIRKMQAYCDDHRIGFRPHLKTHKIPEIARMQRDAGAKGVVCQKLTEAEVFADAGFSDIFVPFNLVGSAKVERLIALAKRTQVSVAADSVVTAQGIAAGAQAAGMEIPLLIECDTGGKRAGVQSPEEVLELARAVTHLKGLRFQGLMTFPTSDTTAAFMGAALDLLKRAGIAAPVVSGGGTPVSWSAHEVPHLTEHRAGTYVYNDHNTLVTGACTLDEISMHVHATVVSRPTADRAILDSGSKTLSSDLHKDPKRGNGRSYGLIAEYPAAIINALSEEHAVVDLSACKERPAIGERVRVIPNHCCVVSNLHDEIHGARGGKVEVTWRVAARGRVR